MEQGGLWSQPAGRDELIELITSVGSKTQALRE